MCLLHVPRRVGWRLAARCSPVPIEDEKMLNANFYPIKHEQEKIPEDTCPPVALRAERGLH